MESSATSSRFRFRDHPEAENATESDTSSDISSISSDKDDESDLESMTAKGIKRLCTELLEIKEASDEDFHRNIFVNYSTFVGILEEVKDMEKELMQLRSQVSTQQRLVKDLSDGIYLKVLSEEMIESIAYDSESDKLSSPNELEAHINDVSETLATLLSENRIDEAIAILELEEENFQRVKLEDKNPSDLLMSYNSAISERKAMLTLQLTLVAENSRISAPELQKALVGLCRLGDSHLVTQLLLKYYHSRLVNGIHNLRSLKSFVHGMYTRELSKLVFSVISQAARSFVMLYGETSAYASELIQWVHEEIEVFVVHFTKYVKSISAITGGLSTAVEAVQFAMSYCSLLGTQRLLLQPWLIKHIHPCMEDVLQTHIDHFKKVVGIFTANDAWVLGRYLVSGILNESYSSMVVGKRLEYCLLTNSGRKFITLLQAIIEDVAPLLSIQMEGFIFRGLKDLFMEYTAILERAINTETNVPEKTGSRIVLAQSLQQQVSILANLSSLEQFFSSTITGIFRGNSFNNSELVKNKSVGFQQQTLDSCVVSIQEASTQLRAHFFQQFIHRLLSLESGCKLTAETCIDSDGEPGLVHNFMPSLAFQVLFLELRKLEKLADDNAFNVDWLMELMRELIVAVFVWISNNKEIWETNQENLTFQHSDVFNQFVLDVHFLVEMTRFGEYFSNDPLVPATLMNSAFISAGLDPTRDVHNVGRATNAATEAIQNLLEIEKTESHSTDDFVGIYMEESPEVHSKHAGETVQDERRSSSEDSVVLEEDLEGTDASEVAVDIGKVKLDAEFSHLGQSSDILNNRGSADGSAMHPTDVLGNSEDIETDDAAYDKFHFIEVTSLPDQLLSVGIGEASEIEFPNLMEERSRNQLDEAESLINKLENDAEVELPGTEIASQQDSVSLQCHHE